MRIGFLIFFIIINTVVNNVLMYLLEPFLGSIYGIIAFYMLSSLIIAFVAALFHTPAGYKKDFYRHPGFHKTMLIYFIVFFAFDIVFMFI